MPFVFYRAVSLSMSKLHTIKYSSNTQKLCCREKPIQRHLLCRPILFHRRSTCILLGRHIHDPQRLDSDSPQHPPLLPVTPQSGPLAFHYM